MPCKFPPCLIKNFGVASFGWLTCLPPFFGLCWAPLLGPALLQALLAPLAALGAPGPVAHSQPCSHLKGEARQLSEGRLLDFLQSTTLTTHCSIKSHWVGFKMC